MFSFWEDQETEKPNDTLDYILDKKDHILLLEYDPKAENSSVLVEEDDLAI